MDQEQENVRRRAVDETEKSIANWILEQATTARKVRSAYTAHWMERLASAILRGEWRRDGNP